MRHDQYTGELNGPLDEITSFARKARAHDKLISQKQAGLELHSLAHFHGTKPTENICGGKSGIH